MQSITPGQHESTSGLRDHADFFVTVAGLLENATDRSRTDAPTLWQRADLQAVYDSAPVGLGSLDKQLRFVRANNCLAKISGISADAHAGRPVAEVLPALGFAVESICRRALRSGEPVIDCEVQGPMSTDTDAVPEWLASCIPRRSDGAITGVQLVLREVTRQKRMEQVLRRNNERLEEQVRLRTAMIEMLHDIASHVHRTARLEEAVTFVLRRVAEFNGWSFGHAFLVSADDPDLLVPQRVFYEQPGEKFSEFRRLTENVEFRRGVGLPGLAFSRGVPVWAENLPDDLGMQRAKAV